MPQRMEEFYMARLNVHFMIFHKMKDVQNVQNMIFHIFIFCAQFQFFVLFYGVLFYLISYILLFNKRDLLLLKWQDWPGISFVLKL